MSAQHETRFAETLKRTSAVAWHGLELRFDLLATELHEERQRILGLIVFTQIAVLAAFMAFLLLNILILVIYWETHRVTAAVILCAFYTVAAIAAAVYARRRARTASRPFVATLEELRKDRAAMKGPDS